MIVLTNLIVMRGQLLKELFDSMLFTNTVHIRDLIFWEKAVVLMNLFTQTETDRGKWL